VVVLADRHFAGFQRLLELAFVAVPEPHIGLDLGELVERLRKPRFGAEAIGAAEPGPRRDLKQERVRRQRQESQPVAIGLVPQRLP
jgi:hypothetical protein